MSCHEVAAALVDEHLPPPPGMRAHLEHCAECRSLARLHASARALQLPEPPSPAVFSPEAIRRVVRRRQRRRRWAASAGASAAVALLAVLVSTRPEPRALSGNEDPWVMGSPLEGEGSLSELLGEVEGYTRTRPSVEDNAYEAFGALATWVRPPESTALEAEPFQWALVAFQVSQQANPEKRSHP
ncbi:hypothetical protein [Melittangium boletus]|uniref:Zinc-finger domain-containing protein n=1 Tax=Melittangium boletus DSM 14713 TaxID=1294270 RepID=A0A250INU3_9BACT|nr:hypothetical protein [Melittangium boletus]ATB32606.1 hypothetical protein MEBOL_006094 [Melittangium boletus DSM 14713]